MLKARIFWLVITTFLLAVDLFGQSPASTNASPPSWVQTAQERAKNLGRTSGGQSQLVRRKSPAEIEEEKEILEEAQQKLTVPPEYYSKYSEFLKSKKYGIARIFPDIGCGEGLTVSVEELERCANVPQIKGGGSLFSFRSEGFIDYPWFKSLSYLFDIHFVENKFVAGNEGIQGIISNIGEISLEELNSESDSLKFLVDFKPKKIRSEFKSQKIVLDAGINENGFFYSTAAQVKLNNTYLLRSIAYYKKRRDYSLNKDLLIAFKVVGQEQNGSIVILWRKLKEKYGVLFKGK